MKYKVGDKFPYRGGYRLFEAVEEVGEEHEYLVAYYQGDPGYFAGRQSLPEASLDIFAKHESYIPAESEPAPSTAPNYYLVKLEDGTEVECRALMKALGLHANFDLASAFKYLWRAGKKHENVAEDLGKAAHFLQMAVADLKKSR